MFEFVSTFKDFCHNDETAILSTLLLFHISGEAEGVMHHTYLLDAIV